MENEKNQVRIAECHQPVPMKGRYVIEHFDKAGNKKGTYEFNNAIVNVGKLKLLDVFFRNQTQIANWYFGLINNSGFTALNVADTMGSHSGWTEWTSYDESARVEWVTGAASGNSITNPSVAQITINAAGNLYGIFLTSNSTKSGTTGTLWTEAAFGSVVPVSIGDVLKLTYTVSC